MQAGATLDLAFFGLPQERWCAKSILETNEFVQIRASVGKNTKYLLDLPPAAPLQHLSLLPCARASKVLAES